MSSDRQDLAEVIAEIKPGDKEVMAREIAAYLIETNQVDQLESLLRDVREKREAEGVIEADVTFSHDIPSEILKQVKQIIRHAKPHAKKITVNTTKDPSVIGGLKVRLSNEQLDMTVRAQLDTFKRLTTEGAN